MTIRLLVALPPFPPGARVAFPAATETALVDAGLASTTLDTADAWVAPPAALQQIPLLLTPITPAQRAGPTAGMLALPHAVFSDGQEWLRVNAAGTDLIPLGEPDVPTRVLPLRNGLAAGSVQMRGATDASNTLGTLGMVVNADTDTEASARFAATDADFTSVLNGASAGSATLRTDWLPAAVRRVHVAVLGLTGPYSVVTSGEVSAATPGMLRLDFDVADNIRWLSLDEGQRSNYAGTPGTGSARQIVVMGQGA
jgi:hypothetical protein